MTRDARGMQRVRAKARELDRMAMAALRQIRIERELLDREFAITLDLLEECAGSERRAIDSTSTADTPSCDFEYNIDVVNDNACDAIDYAGEARPPLTLAQRVTLAVAFLLVAAMLVGGFIFSG